MSFLFKNSLGNSYRENWFQRSNVPTNIHIKIYYSLIQSFMFCVFCWNVVFLLEPVGTTMMDFSCSVGTKKRSNGLFESSNKNVTIHYQHINAEKCSELERWNVGTENDRLLNVKIFL